jgi:hypothetical protein
MNIPKSCIEPFGVLGFPTLNMEAARQWARLYVKAELAKLAGVQPMANPWASTEYTLEIRYETDEDSTESN